MGVGEVEGREAQKRWQLLFVSKLRFLVVCLLSGVSATNFKRGSTFAWNISTVFSTFIFLEVKKKKKPWTKGRRCRMKGKVKVTQSCLTLCNPIQCMEFSRPEYWSDAFPFSRRSSQARDWTQVSRTAGGFFTSWATREAQEYWSGQPIPSPGDLPEPGIELGSPALEVDSLPAEPPGKPGNIPGMEYSPFRT